MINKILFILVLLSININADEFSEWKGKQDQEFAQSKQEFSDWKAKEDAEFKAYLKAQKEAFDEYNKDIKKFWPVSETSTNKKWVEYNKNYTTKKSVDFEKQSINLEVIAKNEKEAKKKIEELYMHLLNDSIKSAYEKDKLEEKILQKLKKPKQILASDEKIISDILTTEDMKKMYLDMKKQKLKVVKYKGKFIYKANIKMPAQSMIRKAKIYTKDVNKSSNKEKIPAELIYAIMHSESSFNPMARSHIPAFGLMQIVPRSAGVDSYKYLYGKRKILSSSYLYNSAKNIKIGSAYLHILYYKYLRGIKDPMSKLFCTIAAYNTGAGNVAKAFIGNTNIYKASDKINSMKSDNVYKHLMRHLPYNETKGYLKKVTDRTSSYFNLIEDNKL